MTALEIGLAIGLVVTAVTDIVVYFRLRRQLEEAEDALAAFGAVLVAHLENHPRFEVDATAGTMTVTFPDGATGTAEPKHIGSVH